MKTQFEELMSGLDDVESFLSGEKEGFKVHVPEKVDVKSIRNAAYDSSSLLRRFRLQP